MLIYSQMRILEKLLVSLTVIALLLTSFEIPGGMLLAFISLQSLFLIYTLFSFALFNDVRFSHIFKRSEYDNVQSFDIMYSVVTGVEIGIGVQAILFSLHPWPGARLLTYLRFLPLFGICAISIFMIIKKKPLGSRLLVRAAPVLCGLVYFIIKYDFFR
jgi:hypothetical protein